MEDKTMLLPTSAAMAYMLMRGTQELVKWIKKQNQKK